MSSKNVLFPSAAKTVNCDKCGYALPLDLGQNSKNCTEWAADTLKKFSPKGVDFVVLSSMITWTRLCDLMAALRMREQPTLFPPAAQVRPPEVKKDA